MKLQHQFRAQSLLLRIYGIEARRFEPGAEISLEVQRAIEEVVQRIIADVSPARSDEELQRNGPHVPN
jgi:Ni,Fe-hydrogenase maturation factor